MSFLPILCIFFTLSHIQVCYGQLVTSSQIKNLTKAMDIPDSLNETAFVPNLRKLRSLRRRPRVKNINKNVNMVVTVDPKEVAEELLKMLEPYLKGRRMFAEDDATLRELENAVSPLLKTPSSARRGYSFGVSVSAVAANLDKLIKQTLDEQNVFDDMTIEILARDIVSNMMLKLKDSMVKNENVFPQSANGEEESAMQIVHNDQISCDDSDFVTVSVNIRRSDLENAIHN